VRRLRSAIRAKELPGFLRNTELDAPILPREDSHRLCPEVDPGVDLSDCCRGALIGGAIGDAMGRPMAGARPGLVPVGGPLQRMSAARVRLSARNGRGRGLPCDMQRA
jgi:hypothetical protein